MLKSGGRGPRHGAMTVVVGEERVSGQPSSSTRLIQNPRKPTILADIQIVYRQVMGEFGSFASTAWRSCTSENSGLENHQDVHDEQKLL